MDVNRLPVTDLTKLEINCCCPRFDPDAWDKLDLHFKDKRFVRAKTRSLFHVPLNMASVFARTWSAVKAVGADDDEFVILSDDSSMWRGEHFFSVTKEVPGLDNVRLTGDYVSRVFEGPYRDAYIWVNEMREDIAQMGRKMGRLFFYYTTCPNCAEKRGKNYVVGVAQVV
jgi:hypothetical protein